MSSVVLLAVAAAGAAGELDPSFGDGGRVTTNFTDESEYAAAVAVQPDGRILVVGSFDLARYLPDGSLDPTFGAGGTATNLAVTSAVDVLLLPDGKFSTAGARFDVDGLGDAEFSLTRFHPDGAVDVAFGENGTATVNPGPNSDLAYGAALQPDGKFVLAGQSVLNPAGSGSPGSQVATTARFHSDGTLDLEFGIGGVVQTFGIDSARDVAVQSDGRVVVAGWAWNADGTNIDFALFRYLPDGSPDETFGTNGKATADFGSHPDIAEAVLVQPDGRIVAGGIVLSPSPANFDFGLARFDADGSPDATFGLSGRVATDFPTSNGFGGFDGLKDLILATDSKLIGVGHGHAMALPFSAPPAAALVRYLPDGSRDPAFGDGGRVTTDFYEEPDQFLAVTIQDDGRIVAAGLAQNSNSPYDDFAIARYIAEDAPTSVASPPPVGDLALRVHPNPGRGPIHILLGGPLELTLDARAFDASGALVRSWLDHRGGSIVWDRTDARGARLPSGVYFIEVRASEASGYRRLVLLD